jgi:hypothetical protein
MLIASLSFCVYVEEKIMAQSNLEIDVQKYFEAFDNPPDQGSGVDYLKRSIDDQPIYSYILYMCEKYEPENLRKEISRQAKIRQERA